MPTYEFRCPNGHEFEKFYRTISTAESVAVCPQCARMAERMMSATGFAFKGSGFYLTDYGKNAHREKGTPDMKAAAGKDAGGDGASSEKPGGEAKGEARSESKPESGKASEGAAPASSESKASKPDAKPAESKPAASVAKPSANE